MTRDAHRSKYKLEMESHVFLQQHTLSIGSDVMRVGSYLTSPTPAARSSLATDSNSRSVCTNTEKSFQTREQPPKVFTMTEVVWWLATTCPVVSHSSNLCASASTAAAPSCYPEQTVAFKHQVSLFRRCFHFFSFGRLGDRLAVEQEKRGGGGRRTWTNMSKSSAPWRAPVSACWTADCGLVWSAMAWCDRGVQTLLATVGAFAAFSLMTIAIGTDYWLYSRAYICNTTNATTDETQTQPKTKKGDLTHSGLWRICCIEGEPVRELYVLQKNTE